MAYHKFLIDNPTCSRRFHLTFDDIEPKVPRTEVRCQFCNIVIFTAEDHPPIHFARAENLVKTSALSENLIFQCAFEDTLTKRTVPSAANKDPAVYPDHK